jgi:hypothetical protein
LKIDPKEDLLRQRLKERYNHAVAEMASRYRIIQAGRETNQFLFDAAGRLLKAGLEVAETGHARVTFLDHYLELARDVEGIIAAQVESGRVEEAELHRARYLRADAEVQLLREKAKEKADKKN